MEVTGRESHDGDRMRRRGREKSRGEGRRGRNKQKEKEKKKRGINIAFLIKINKEKEEPKPTEVISPWLLITITHQGSQGSGAMAALRAVCAAPSSLPEPGSILQLSPNVQLQDGGDSTGVGRQAAHAESQAVP